MLVVLIFALGLTVTAVTVAAVGMAEAADPAHGAPKPEPEENAEAKKTLARPAAAKSTRGSRWEHQPSEA